MWTRQQLKDWAKDAVSKNYWKAVLVSIILAIAVGGSGGSTGGSAGSSISNTINSSSNYTGVYDFQSAVRATQYYIEQNWQYIVTLAAIVIGVILLFTVIAYALKIFLFNPLEIGAKKYFTASLGNPETSLNELGAGFSHNYSNGILTLFLRDLFIWLWSLLLVFPGWIKHYEYLMVPYLIGENPQMDHKTAFALSKKMMAGEKWHAFVIDLSFIGWNFLSFFTCGLLRIFYVAPYQNYTNAALYKVLCNKLSA